ncbi:MAG: DVUA0089 family protein [Opitutaceae bacterium]|nr:DVUA0089 family protein [Opitutaceae bacterium]
MKKPTPFLLIALLALATPALALDFDFNGTFTHDNDIALNSFTVGSASTVTIFTSSWLTGGFDPVLTLWSGSGNFLQEQDDSMVGAGSALSNAVTYNFGQWDSYFHYTLAPGTYTVSVAQYRNSAAGTNLSSGFQEDGNPNFTYDYGWGTQPYFNGILNNNDTRNGNWALHVTGVNPENHQGVPDASSTAALLGLAILALVGLKRRFS